ncbi:MULTISPECIES: cation:proton antiporter subunit C [Corynebacterium]|uniref:Cation:proton antiporter n=1 Tax=Corynebacterium flavescens TaxID=28028 RepID=A0A1L7CMS5_CORFL|nr:MULTISPECIES: cation:proton antiporter subunit C [Corynebacterium]APT87118.1 cation:proton antiporter [Corynebacterium flavescens]KAA8721359.1 cation:proton antiporter [Corynebacterium flavescens]MDN6100034.1 cation:proton antiporter subunit C [Corynebacterium flavescens]MDN6200169.1 cation:proton antiporter subunit C [Corynebacterium flavescens]MDN6226644.1 cation:proton antiporter subunit C [Corynebacterium flavescens]
MILALTIAVLVGGAVYLIQQRGLVHIVLGMMSFGHGVNLTLLATGVYSYRGEAFPSRVPFEEMSDPLPQAFVLTAVVISMATSTILLTMAAMGANDDTNVVEPVDDNTVDHAFSTLGRDSQNREILSRSDEHMHALRRGTPPAAHENPASAVADGAEGRRDQDNDKNEEA